MKLYIILFIAVLLFSTQLPIAKKIGCNNEIPAKKMKKWTMYFDVFWLFNIIGEAIPQLIIRYVLHYEILFELDKHLWLCSIQCILDYQKEDVYSFNC